MEHMVPLGGTNKATFSVKIIIIASHKFLNHLSR